MKISPSVHQRRPLSLLRSDQTENEVQKTDYLLEKEDTEEDFVSEEEENLNDESEEEFEFSEVDGGIDVDDINNERTDNYHEEDQEEDQEEEDGDDNVDDDLWEDYGEPLFQIYARDFKWLEKTTEDLLDLEQYPLGELTENDVQTITGLMAAWAKRRSVSAALIVEKLLKRVVDDMQADNPVVYTTTKMYSLVS